MKESINLVDYIIVQIDEFNISLLDSFQKGFMIPEKALDEFVVYKDYIVNKGHLPADFPTENKIQFEIRSYLANSDDGMSFDTLKKVIIADLNLSDESTNLCINDMSDILLLDLVIERVILKLKKQNIIKQFRKNGERFYKLHLSMRYKWLYN